MRKVLIFALLAVSAVAYAAVGVPGASATVVTVTLEGSAKGSVTSDPAGIDCSNVPGAEATDCSFDFPLNFTNGVTLTADGAEGAALRDWTGTAGGTCSGATNPCVTAPTLFDPLGVTATFAPKPDRPSVATGAARDIAFPSAVLSGTVNPNSADFGVGDCYFEYGTSTDYGVKVPCHPGPPGPGTDAVPVTGPVGLLPSSTTYHYRVVAVAAGGTSVGQDRTFTSASAPPDHCPNAAIRAQQGVIAQRLPDCLAYELVSPPSTAGQIPNAQAIGDTGDDVLFTSGGGFADVGNLMNLGTTYRAHRTGTGWKTSWIGGPPAADFPQYSQIDWTADWWKTDRPSTMWPGHPVTSPADFLQPVVGKKGGPWLPIAPAGPDAIYGTTTDLSGVLLSGEDRPPLTDGTTDARSAARNSLTVSVRSPDGTLDVRQVAKQNGTTMFPTCDVSLGAGANGVTRGAVARDGFTRIVFTMSGTTSCRTADLQRVWVAEPFSADPDAFDASASRCTTDCGTAQVVKFAGGSLDTTRLFMTTAEKLLDADGQPGVDLYEYDFDRPTNDRLHLLTGDAAPANVLGVVAVSDAGTHVYFVARGRLPGAIANDAEPVVGAPNLYVWIADASDGSSVTKFVGTLSEADSALWGSGSHPVAITPDGRYLAFASQAPLTADKQAGDRWPDMYRFDAETGGLLRAWTDSPDHNGASRHAGSYIWGPSTTGPYANSTLGQVGIRSISDDGNEIYFNSAEPLMNGDTNDNDDAFVWTASTRSLMMVSDGQAARGTQAAGMTPDGRSFFFSTPSQLVAQHTATSVGLYAVRRDGGFPAPDPSPAPCRGDACQGPLIPGPGPFAGVASSTFTGGQNVAPPKVAPPKEEPGKVRVSKVETVHGTSTRVRVKVPGKGRIRTSGSGLRRAHKTAKQAGSYRVTVRLSKRARRTLKRKHRVRVRVSVRFTPATGKRQTVRVRVTFQAKRPHRGSSSRAARRVSVLSATHRKGR